VKKSSAMKIGIVSIIKEPWGGSEELWADMATEALKDGQEVYISALDCGPVSTKTAKLLQNGAKLYYRRGFIKPGTPFLQRVFRKGLIFLANKLQNPFHRLFREKPDVVFYAGTAYSISDDQLLLQALRKTPAVLYLNCQLNTDKRGFGQINYEAVAAAYKQARKVLFVSAENRDTARRHTCSDIANSIIIRNPVNLAGIGIIPFPATDTVQLAMVGILVTDHKGQDLVMEVLHREEWKKRNWHLNIYGSGPDEGYLKRLCAFYGLENRITFHGRVSDISQVWQQNSLLLMPSHQEGMPLAVVEAMVCGRPTVATDVGGHREWITDGIEGFISEGVSVNAIGDTMERAWLRKDEWAEMGKAAHNKALSLYNPAPGRTVLNLLMNYKERDT
jgi:glycosyltransferase involved in cell wall biosynthesis